MSLEGKDQKRHKELSPPTFHILSCTRTVGNGGPFAQLSTDMLLFMPWAKGGPKKGKWHSWFLFNKGSRSQQEALKGLIVAGWRLLTLFLGQHESTLHSTHTLKAWPFVFPIAWVIISMLLILIHFTTIWGKATFFCQLLVYHPYKIPLFIYTSVTSWKH